MAIDTPARLAILGAGPIGLEAALYARFLGYDVVVYEQGEIAASVRRWGPVRMFTPFGQNRSSLGLAAIEAHDEAFQPPADDAVLTGQEWIARYLLPLAQTDLVADHLRLNTTVVAVGKEEVLRGDLPAHGDSGMPGHDDRGDWTFRVLSRNAAGEEQIEAFDGVLDCTGVFANANWLGHGGIPAVGEIDLRSAIEYRLPDILGQDRPKYAGKHTLVIGAGTSAATNIVALAELAASEYSTRVTWITRREGAAAAGGPVQVITRDPLPARASLARRANELSQSGGAITYWPQTVVEKIVGRLTPPARQGFAVELSGEHAGTIQVDEIIANVGFRPDHSFLEELQIEHDPRRADGPGPLRQAESNFYLLGHKSFGRSPGFLFRDGLEQIRDVFRIIGDRDTLDLYATARPLPR
jgi:thioredoxin reductase